MAKDLSTNQEGFNQMLNMYASLQQAELKAVDEMRGEQMKALGDQAGTRITGINDYIAKNFDGEIVQAIQSMVTTADSVKAIEALIQSNRNAPVAPTDAPAAPATTRSDVEAMQFELDKFGNRRINTDPSFRAEYERLKNATYGTHEHREQVG